MLIPMLLIFGVMYLLVIRPQSKKAKEHQKMLSELQKGDDVATSGGLIGRITGIKDDVVTLQVQEGVRLRVFLAGLQRRESASGFWQSTEPAPPPLHRPHLP